MKPAHELILAAVALTGLACLGQARDFVDATGRRIEAEIVSVDGSSVTVQRSDGGQFTVEVEVFSEADQEYIRAWSPAGIPAPAMRSEAAPTDEDLKPGTTLTLEFPDLPKDRRDQPASCNLRIPDSYDPGKPFGLVVWLGGSDGGNQPTLRFAPEGPFIFAGLPYPKGANNPGQASMVGEYDEVWEYQQTMLDRIFEKIPNLRKEWSVLAGFSNGGHSIDGMLRARGGTVADYFGAFVLVDGGGGYASSGGRYPALAGKHAYVCWGETSPNAANSQGVAADFRRRGAETVASEMAATGHSFAEFEQEKIREWLATVVTPSWRTE